MKFRTKAQVAQLRQDMARHIQLDDQIKTIANRHNISEPYTWSILRQQLKYVPAFISPEEAQMIRRHREDKAHGLTTARAA